MRHLEDSRHLRHHAFVIEEKAEEGIEAAQAWVERELGMKTKSNPDVVVLRYGLFSVEDARRVTDIAAGAPFVGEHKVVIIAASRVYREAQNALLKIFEEPPLNTYLFLVLPTFGGLLPTLRSRVTTLGVRPARQRAEISDIAHTFIENTKEKRSALIKKLASGGDEEERREHRDEALAIMNGIESIAYAALQNDGYRKSIITNLLSDIATLRGHLHDRSAPVKMILEHLSLVIPKDLI